MTVIQTEFEFELPVGYVAPDGVGHKTGKMRLATAADELALMADPRAQANDAYAALVMLSKVITQLGTLSEISLGVIEGLFVADLSYLQALYRQINETGKTLVSVTCSHCNEAHEIDLLTLGGADATP